MLICQLFSAFYKRIRLSKKFYNLSFNFNPMLVGQLLEKGIRLDRRELDQDREIKISRYENFVLVRSGCDEESSYILIAYSLSITKPYVDRPSEGIFQIALEKGKKNDVLLNFLHSVYVKSKCVSLPDLCIKFNQSVYAINIEIFPIQSNGDLNRLCVAGINEIIKILELKTYFTPAVFQFSSSSSKLIFDPTQAEVDESSWKVLAVMKSTREFLQIEKIGIGISFSEYQNALERILEKAKAYYLSHPKF